MKFNLKTIIAVVAFSVSATIAKSQTISATNGGLNSGIGVMTSEGGNPIGFSEYTGLVGNPFFNPDWVKGDVTFADGNVVKDKLVKYDEFKDKLFTQVAGTAKSGEFDQPVTSFTIITADGTLASFSIFPGNGKTSDNAFFQVLSDGKVKLLRKNAKTISEYKANMSSAVTTREVVDNIDYYLLIGGKAVRIKKDKKSVEAALGNKQAELESYIKANNLNLKNDADLAKLITQYNTL
jgi:hypothetical protein